MRQRKMLGKKKTNFAKIFGRCKYKEKKRARAREECVNEGGLGETTTSAATTRPSCRPSAPSPLHPLFQPPPLCHSTLSATHSINSQRRLISLVRFAHSIRFLGNLLPPSLLLKLLSFFFFSPLRHALYRFMLCSKSAAAWEAAKIIRILPQLLW